MYSQLFRLETARRLRAIAGQVVDSYHGRRYPWLDAYMAPDRSAVLQAIKMLSEAVAEGDVSWYEQYAVETTEQYLATGMPPIAVLAAHDILFEIIQSYLTPDQRDLLVPILEAERTHLQTLVQAWLTRRMVAAGA